MPFWLQRREKLRQIIFETDTISGKAFDLILLACILTSVLVILLGSVKAIQIQYGQELHWAEWFFTLLFTIEYILRLISAQRPWRYALSFYGIVDLITVLPTYISLLFPASYSLLAVRTLRLLRIFRILKLSQFLQEQMGLMLALKASMRKIIVFLAFVLVLVIILGSLMYFIEGEANEFTSIPVSIYWAIVTLTTVGYGDIAPQTPLGKLLASIIMLLGYGIIAVPTGIVTVDLSNSHLFKGSNQTCSVCGSQRHDDDARYCKYCGNVLSNKSPN
jgi:voltage-gated potassium channel